MADPLSRSKAKVIIGIVALVVLVGLGTMLVIGLVQGDEVDREENPVNGAPASGLVLHAPSPQPAGQAPLSRLG